MIGKEPSERNPCVIPEAPPPGFPLEFLVRSSYVAPHLTACVVLQISEPPAQLKRPASGAAGSPPLPRSAGSDRLNTRTGSRPPYNRVACKGCPSDHGACWLVCAHPPCVCVFSNPAAAWQTWRSKKAMPSRHVTVTSAGLPSPAFTSLEFRYPLQRGKKKKEKISLSLALFRAPRDDQRRGLACTDTYSIGTRQSERVLIFWEDVI